jgi:hypothetical protein
VEELNDWLKVGAKAEVEWEGEWWEVQVRKIIITQKGRVGKVEVEYVGSEEEEAEWIEITYTKVLGWVSTRMRELEPEPEPVPEPAAQRTDAGGGRMSSVGGSGLKADRRGVSAGAVLETSAEKKARVQARLTSSRTSTTIVMDMDD